ncbi:MAG TPA: hypothetical protein VG649_20660 [Candidatus Angelobacter sp.]|nr:hypothetical protein [Candidatus Angelobacter sp.]
MRWITFDQETYSAIRSMHPRENVFEFPARSPLQYALEAKNTVVAVLPAAPTGIAVVTFHKQRSAVPDLAVASPGTARAGGILGLRDEPAFQEEETPEKRNWWRRFWDY